MDTPVVVVVVVVVVKDHVIICTKILHYSGLWAVLCLEKPKLKRFQLLPPKEYQSSKPEESFRIYRHHGSPPGYGALENCNENFDSLLFIS